MRRQLALFVRREVTRGAWSDAGVRCGRSELATFVAAERLKTAPAARSMPPRVARAQLRPLPVGLHLLQAMQSF